jgi:hypothetical protein
MIGFLVVSCTVFLALFSLWKDWQAHKHPLRQYSVLIVIVLLWIFGGYNSYVTSRNTENAEKERVGEQAAAKAQIATLKDSIDTGNSSHRDDTKLFLDKLDKLENQLQETRDGLAKTLGHLDYTIAHAKSPEQKEAATQIKKEIQSQVPIVTNSPVNNSVNLQAFEFVKRLDSEWAAKFEGRANELVSNLHIQGLLLACRSWGPLSSTDFSFRLNLHKTCANRIEDAAQALPDTQPLKEQGLRTAKEINDWIASVSKDAPPN